jgi:hypothetical protein
MAHFLAFEEELYNLGTSVHCTHVTNQPGFERTALRSMLHEEEEIILLRQLNCFFELQHDIQNLYCSIFTTTAYYSTTASKTSTAEDL